MNWVELPIGSSLLEVESIVFGCRAAACGRCRIQVIEGSENLSPETEKETRAKSILQIGGTDIRLACQVKAFGKFSFKNIQRERKKI